MSEMKTWVTPEVEVQTFQANEYVSACYTGEGKGVGNTVFSTTRYYLWNDINGDSKVDDGEVGERVTAEWNIDGDFSDWPDFSVNSDVNYNSGTMHKLVESTYIPFDGWSDPVISDQQLFESVNGASYIGNSFKRAQGYFS